jgi:ubiquinone/menaquinone biosynthesis C-methylase UbiE
MTIDIHVFRDEKRSGEIKVSRSAPSCCGASELENVGTRAYGDEEIKSFVRRQYARIADTGSGCSCGCDDGSAATISGYSELPGYASQADLGLGCGIPTVHAGFRRGQTVLDLGSGAGIDAFVAREAVGDSGQVIGVDMTPEMVRRAEENRQKLGFDNVRFVLGDIESLPIPDESVDVVISNCVLNLVPDKRRAFEEMYRVLRPGGRFAVSDIVFEGDFPEALRDSMDLYAACVSGAIERQSYLETLEAVGFEEIEVVHENAEVLPDDGRQFLASIAAEAGADNGRSGHRDLIMVSMTVVGVKADR